MKCCRGDNCPPGRTWGLVLAERVPAAEVSLPRPAEATLYRAHPSGLSVGADPPQCDRRVLCSFRIAIDHILFPGVKLDALIHNNRNWGAGVVAGSVTARPRPRYESRPRDHRHTARARVLLVGVPTHAGPDYVAPRSLRR